MPRADWAFAGRTNLVPFAIVIEDLVGCLDLRRKRKNSRGQGPLAAGTMTEAGGRTNLLEQVDLGGGRVRLAVRMSL